MIAPEQNNVYIRIQRQDTADGDPYLSVCVVGRNCEKTVEAMLKSVRERMPQAEVVYVDTCSNDGSPEIAKRYADIFEVYRGPKGTWDEDMYAVDIVCDDAVAPFYEHLGLTRCTAMVRRNYDRQ